jgi:hypothetical protein
VANAFISPFNTQTMPIKHNSSDMFHKNLIPWRDSNPGLLVLEADTMSTAPELISPGCFLFIVNAMT